MADGLPGMRPNGEAPASATGDGAQHIQWGTAGQGKGDVVGAESGGGGSDHGQQPGAGKARQGSSCGLGRLFNAAGLKFPPQRSSDDDDEEEGEEEESKYIAQHRRNFQQSQQRLRMEVAIAAAPWEDASKTHRKSTGACV
jgi:hypothetical protein